MIRERRLAHWVVSDRGLVLNKLAVAALVGLVVAACGGAQKSAKRQPTVTTTATVTVTQSSSTATTTAAPVAGVVAETVRTAGPGAGWGSTISAGPGDVLQFRTALHRKRPAEVRLVVARGPKTRLTVTATVGGHSSGATVTSANGQRLTLLGLHYTCTAPPDPSFCPIHGVSTTATTFGMGFRASGQAPIVVGATVGPTNRRGPVPPDTASFPYKVFAAGRSVAPAVGGAKPVESAFGSSVTVKPGDLVILTARLVGRFTGPPARLQVTVRRGPGTSLTAVASVPGHRPSTVEIKSFKPSSITIVLPRYSCNVPPDPTYCPVIEAHSSRATFTAEFRASPRLPPITLLAGIDGPKGLAPH